MEIVCKQCKYHMSKIAISIYLTAAIAKLIQEIHPYIVKRNMMEDGSKLADDVFVAIANALKIECPMCCQYKEWYLIEEGSKAIE